MLLFDSELAAMPQFLSIMKQCVNNNYSLNNSFGNVQDGQLCIYNILVHNITNLMMNVMLMVLNLTSNTWNLA